MFSQELSSRVAQNVAFRTMHIFLEAAHPFLPSRFLFFEGLFAGISSEMLIFGGTFPRFNGSIELRCNS